MFGGCKHAKSANINLQKLISMKYYTEFGRGGGRLSTGGSLSPVELL